MSAKTMTNGVVQQQIKPVAKYPVIPNVYQDSVEYMQKAAPTQQVDLINRFDKFGEVPKPTTCPSCRANVISRTSRVRGTCTWAACCGFSLFGCCFLPFCIDTFKDVDHTCPNCNTLMGKYKLVQ